MKASERLKFNNTLVARNKIIMPPMDTLMANDGFANDFHIQHYGARAYGGVGTIIVESTAVAEEGKIRDGDLGLWKDDHIIPLQRVAALAHQANALIGVQLNHAGAKSENTTKDAIGPTNFYSYLNNEKRKFRLMQLSDVKELKVNFINAAKRAKSAGFDFVELHGAHGYLINQLIHPTLNESFPADNILARAKFLIEIIDVINSEIKIPVGIRLSISDHDEKGVDENYYKELIEVLSPKVIYFNISSGETISRARSEELIKKAGTKIFRIPLAKKVKEWTDKIVFTGGNVSSKEDVEFLLKNNIDGAFVGRELLFNPNFVVTTLLSPEEIDEVSYHWNNNLWYSHKRYLSLMKELKLK